MHTLLSSFYYRNDKALEQTHLNKPVIWTNKVAGVENYSMTSDQSDLGIQWKVTVDRQSTCLSFLYSQVLCECCLVHGYNIRLHMKWN